MAGKSQTLQSHFPTLARACLLPVIVTALLWATSEYHISLLQFLAALFLLWMPWQAYLRWQHGARKEIPLFALVTAVYWLYFAVSLFWEERGYIEKAKWMVTDDDYTKVMLMAALGVGMLWLGIKSRLGRLIAPSSLPDISPRLSRRNYLRVVLIIGTLGSFYESTP